MLLQFWTPWQLELVDLGGFLEPLWLGCLQSPQLLLSLPRLLLPCSKLFTTLCLPEVSAPSCSPEHFDPLGVAGCSLELSVSVLYSTSSAHSTKDKNPKLNTQTMGCALYWGQAFSRTLCTRGRSS